jgi:hypothetical protein
MPMSMLPIGSILASLNVRYAHASIQSDSVTGDESEPMRKRTQLWRGVNREGVFVPKSAHAHKCTFSFRTSMYASGSRGTESNLFESPAMVGATQVQVTVQEEVDIFKTFAIQ